MDTQAGNEAGHASIHSHGLRHRAMTAKPLIQEEFGLGNEDTAHRQKAWAAFTAGAAGSGTGAFLVPLANFAAQVDFERMDPADALALSANAYVLAERGVAYVLYLYDGGTVRLDLRGVSGTFDARWYDPRAGSFRSAGSVAGGQERSFTAPSAGDWTLYVQKTGTSTPPSALVNRGETAGLLMTAMHGAGFVPPAASGIFADVPHSHWAAAAIEQVYRDGVTSGCGTAPRLFCPGNLLTRAEMAVLMLRARYGSGYNPPPATGHVFDDVPLSYWAAPWIERLYALGITAGCGPRKFCPATQLSAWELSVFIGAAFGTP
jgi:hypothetical protein